MRYTLKIGDKFNYWTIIDYDKQRKKYKCGCDCGNTSYVSSAALKNGTSKSCGCKQKQAVGQRIVDSGYSSIKVKIYGNYKKAAEKRGYSFDIERLDFNDMITGSCVYCGSGPTMTYKYGRGNHATDYTEFRYNGVDRVDNTLGYSKENCVSCCKICNNAKASLSVQNWFDWIDKIAAFAEVRANTNK